MPRLNHTHLSRRESQIMEVMYRLQQASVADVQAHMGDQPAYNSVRVTLGILEKKGYVTHEREGQRYVYRPVISPERAKRSALKDVLRTFFKGSPSKAILTLLDMNEENLTEQDLDQIEQWIQEARKEEVEL